MRLAILPLLLWGCAAGTPGPEPEELSARETLERIEAIYLTARTLRIQFAIESTGASASGLILLKDENKAHVKMSAVLKGKAADLRLVSDGLKTQMKGLNAGDLKKAPHEVDTRRFLKRDLTRYLVLLGALPSTTLETNTPVSALEQASGTPFGDLKISDFRFEASGDGMKSIAYTLDLGGSLEIRLWYEPKTYKLLKRTTTAKARSGQAVSTEVYEECTLNGEIEDARFRLYE